MGRWGSGGGLLCLVRPCPEDTNPTPGLVLPTQPQYGCLALQPWHCQGPHPTYCHLMVPLPKVNPAGRPSGGIRGPTGLGWGGRSG